MKRAGGQRAVRLAWLATVLQMVKRQGRGQEGEAEAATAAVQLKSSTAAPVALVGSL